MVFGGFFIGLIGVIIVACLSNLKEEESRRAEAERERVRLREQVRQEQSKNEVYRQHSTQRLDAHDNALGMDTRSPEALPGQSSSGRALGSLQEHQDVAPPPLRPGPAIWYYERNGQSRGPVPEEEIRTLLRQGTISRDSLVWCDGFTDWTPVRDVEAFA